MNCLPLQIFIWIWLLDFQLSSEMTKQINSHAGLYVRLSLIEYRLSSPLNTTVSTLKPLWILFDGYHMKSLSNGCKLTGPTSFSYGFTILWRLSLLWYFCLITSWNSTSWYRNYSISVYLNTFTELCVGEIKVKCALNVIRFTFQANSAYWLQRVL